MQQNHIGRRAFLQLGAQATVIVGLMRGMNALSGAPILAASTGVASGGSTPWYQRCFRWGQTWLTDRAPSSYDVEWWRSYWKQTAVQGAVINAGGLAAYYPTKIPFHHQAEFLDNRDMYGEVAEAAHRDGLAVLARLDSSAAYEDCYRAHPDWFARDQSGKPYEFHGQYLTCVSGAYYEEYIPSILEEIIARTHPEGIIESAWSRLTRNTICYCENCARRFRDKTGLTLPKEADWNDNAYRRWNQWKYDRHTEIWELNNRVTQGAGGPHCLWSAMLYLGGLLNQDRRFFDVREIGRRSQFLYWDNDARASDGSGFQANGDAGKQIFQITGWDKLVIETMGLPYQILEHPVDNMSEKELAELAAKDPVTYDRIRPMGGSYFRMAAKPEPEARLWMLEGIAGNMAPIWVFSEASHEDRRMYHTPERVFQWHKESQEYLVNRNPVARVGIVWSQRNADYFGRDNPGDRVDGPYRGFVQALVKARIPYLPIHAADIEQQGREMAVLILPNMGSLSDSECEAVRQFVRRGGGLVATGATSLYDEWGEPRSDFGLADLFGVHAASPEFGRQSIQRLPTYLRLHPEQRGSVWGPKVPNDPKSGVRHSVLKGFEETDIISFGGRLEKMRVESDVIVPLTFVSPAGGYSGKREALPQTDIPGLMLRTVGQSRVAFLPADLDFRQALNSLPDSARLLTNLVHWAGGGDFGFELQGPGFIDCHVFQQPKRLIVHLINLNNQGSWDRPVTELVPVGPFRMRVRRPRDVSGRRAMSLVSKATLKPVVKDDWVEIELGAILDHEVITIA